MSRLRLPFHDFPRGKYRVMLNRTITAELHRTIRVFGEEFVYFLPKTFVAWIAEEYAYYYGSPLPTSIKQEAEKKIDVVNDCIYFSEIASQLLLCVIGLHSPIGHDLSQALRDHIQCEKELASQARQELTGLSLDARRGTVASLPSNFARQVRPPFLGQKKNGAWQPKAKI